DMRQFEEAKRTNRFREKFGISKDKLIFFFGGILGPSQSLEFVLQVAERVKDLPDAVFLFVGDGTEKEKLMEIAKEKNLENVIFKPLVSKEEFPSLLKDADVGLVSLTSRNTTPIFPAKIPAYMAAGVPVLAFVNKESLRSTLIEEAKCGFVAESTDIGKAEELARKMYRDRKNIAKLGENGRFFAEKNLNAALAAEEIGDLLRPNGSQRRAQLAYKRLPKEEEQADV
ncbi:MAG: glycosyltransferase family 4 protein, partial [Pseudomonadota bacterium]